MKLYPYLSIEICRQVIAQSVRNTINGGLESKWDLKMGQYIHDAGYVVEDLWQALENIICPALIIRGEESRFISREDTIKMCDIMPKAIWAEIPGSSHVPMHENPDAFNRVALSFLSQKKFSK